MTMDEIQVVAECVKCSWKLYNDQVEKAIEVRAGENVESTYDEVVRERSDAHEKACPQDGFVRHRS